MIRSILIIVVILTALGLYGCSSKPPKDVAINIAAGYLEKAGIKVQSLDEIKYLSAYEKNGGYTVNLQVDKLLCELDMLKVDTEEKGWMGKGFRWQGPAK